MRWILVLLPLLVVTGGVRGEPCQSSKPRNSKQCVPIGRGTCVTGVDNGTSLDWYEASRMCGNYGGRQIWVVGSMNLSFFQHTRLSNKSDFDFIYTGLQILSNGKIHAITDQNIICPKTARNSIVCAENTTQSELFGNTTCDDVGCCVDHQHCNYPALIVSPSQYLTSTIKCLGLQKTNGTWGWAAFDCNTEGDATTGYICEYTCHENSTWPAVAFSVANITAATGTPPEHPSNSGDSGSGDATGNTSSPYTITGGLLLLFLCCHILNNKHL